MTRKASPMTQAMRPLAIAGLIVAMTASLTTASSASSAGWTSVKLPSGTAQSLSFNSVSCVGTKCLAVGYPCAPAGCGGSIPSQVFVSSNAGASWRLVPIAATYTTLSSLVCATATRCLVVAEKLVGDSSELVILRSLTGGASWSPVALPSGFSPYRVTCPTASTCWSVGSRTSSAMAAVARTSNFGNRWVQVNAPTGVGTLSAVACSSAARCLVVSGGATPQSASVRLTLNGGATWRAVATPPGFGSFGAIACTNVRHCVMVGYSMAAVSTDGGLTWSSRSVPKTASLFAVSCASSARCIAVGQFTPVSGPPAVFMTTNGGASWVAQSVPTASPGLLNAVSCGTLHCVSVGYVSPSVTSASPFMIRD